MGGPPKPSCSVQKKSTTVSFQPSNDSIYAGEAEEAAQGKNLSFLLSVSRETCHILI